MRVSAMEMQRKITAMIPTVTDQELFCSRRYQAYLTDLAESIIGKSSLPVKVFTRWDGGSDSLIGATNGNMILIDVANHITQSLPTMALRNAGNEGIVGHECGHIKYTDFSMRKMFLQTLASGRFYPARPVVNEVDDKIWLLELEEVFACGDLLKNRIIMQAAQRIRNILEDYYVNFRICDEYGGSVKYGLQIFLARQASLYPSIHAQVEQNYADYAIMLNLIHQYSVFGEVNNLGGYSGPYLDVLDEVAPIIDDAFSEDPKARLVATNLLLVKLWPYISKLVDENKEEQERSGLDDETQAAKAEQKIEQQTSPQPDAAQENPVPPTSSSPGSNEEKGEGCSDITDEMRKALEDINNALNRNTIKVTDDFDDGGDGGISYDDDYAGTGAENNSEWVTRELLGVARDKALASFEEDLTDELREEAKRIRLGNAHKGVNLVIHRQPVIAERTIEDYKSVAEPLKLLAKKMAKLVIPFLPDESETGKTTGLFSGPMLDPTRLYDPQGGMFCANEAEEDGLDIVAYILGDISGSMTEYGRIDAAKASTLVLYEFCRDVGIPVAACGHCSHESAVHIYSYADFDSVDGLDRYRIFEMKPEGCNRDGAALRFVGERLLRRPEGIKLLFLISDGQPNEGDYFGTAAEADLRGIYHEFTNKGITFIAAAIGDDRPIIERIYGKSFLDIGDLERLPTNLLNILVKCIR